MPILQVTTPAQVTTIVELSRLTRIKLDLYAEWIKASTDQVVNEALQLVFRSDDSFQNFLITKRAEAIHSNIQQHAMREIEMRNQEFAEFLANDLDNHGFECDFRMTLCAHNDAKNRRRA